MNKKFLLPGLIFSLFFLAFASKIYAAPKDLADKFLSKAEKSLAENDVDKAYNYVNTTLVMAYEDFSKDDKESCEKLISSAQHVYAKKINQLLKNFSNNNISYDDLISEVDKIKRNINKYPLINNSAISEGLLDISNALILR